ncbi:MAG: HNH endonuclease [Nanoarchaeota archaeon]
MKSVLLLNNSYEIIGIINWTKAVSIYMMGKAKEPIGHDENHQINTVRGIYNLPTVLILNKYIKIPHKEASLRKINIAKRDRYQCQYCGKKLTDKTITIDHVNPRSNGGKHEWKNVVTACRPCNNKKDNRTPEQANMKLLSVPYIPKRSNLLLNSIDKNNYSWQKFIKQGIA